MHSFKVTVHLSRFPANISPHLCNSMTQEAHTILTYSPNPHHCQLGNPEKPYWTERTKQEMEDQDDFGTRKRQMNGFDVDFETTYATSTTSTAIVGNSSINMCTHTVKKEYVEQ
uniref:Uncharacterized protein n=1 Tax=Tanacetum cinerariifolium TaxID=118510 RepID=A0A699GRQ1_TANCI|nr:hypothetical protein [Tanacetum cinerariifolium]